MGGGDVFAGIPKRRRRGQGHHIEEKRGCGSGRSLEVRGSLLSHAIPCSGPGRLLPNLQGDWASPPGARGPAIDTSGFEWVEGVAPTLAGHSVGF